MRAAFRNSCVIAATMLLLASSVSAEDAMHWQPSLETAQRVAAQSGRLILVHFWAPWCKPCMRMEKEVFARPETGRGLQANFVLVKLNVDESPATARLYGVTSLPADVILTPKGQLVAQLESPPSANQYINQLNQLAAGYNKMNGAQVAARATAAPLTTAPPETRQYAVPAQATAPLAGPVLGPATSNPVGGHADLSRAAPPVVMAPAVSYGPQSAPSRQPSAYATQTATGQQPSQSSAVNRSVPLPPGSPPLGLDGYCPVHLARKSWTKGDARWGAIHHGRTYLFAGPEEQKQFLVSPDAFAPVMGGQDPVLALDAGRQVAGRREFGVYYGNRVYLLADEISYQRFKQNPNRYAAEAMQARRDFSPVAR